jgi:hypothetical protein
MKIKTGKLKKIILPLLFFISLCFNILYLFNIIDFKINLKPSGTKELQNKTFKQFWDSPIVTIDSIRDLRNNDTVERFKPEIEPGDTLKIQHIY